MTQEQSIGSLAKHAATKVQTIRFYVQEGLMPEPSRSRGGQRRYSQAHADRWRSSVTRASSDFRWMPFGNY